MNRDEQTVGAIRLYFRYAKLHTLGMMQYSGWWAVMFIYLAFCITDPLEVMVLFARFGPLGDFGINRIMMIYGWALSAFGTAEIFARGFDVFPNRVKNGTFDRILLRPRSTFLQTMVLQFQLHRIVRSAFGMILAIAGMAMETSAVGVSGVIMLALSFLSGVTIYIAVFLIQAAAAFFTVETVEFAYVFTNGSYQTAKAPPDALPNWTRRLFTFVMPMFAFCYFPLSVAFGWGDPAWTGWVAAPAAAILMGVGIIIWKQGVRHYKSAGS